MSLEKTHFEKILGNFVQDGKYVEMEAQIVEVGENPTHTHTHTYTHTHTTHTHTHTYTHTHTTHTHTHTYTHTHTVEIGENPMENGKKRKIFEMHLF